MYFRSDAELCQPAMAVSTSNSVLWGDWSNKSMTLSMVDAWDAGMRTSYLFTLVHGSDLHGFTTRKQRIPDHAVHDHSPGFRVPRSPLFGNGSVLTHANTAACASHQHHIIRESSRRERDHNSERSGGGREQGLFEHDWMRPRRRRAQSASFHPVLTTPAAVVRSPHKVHVKTRLHAV